MAKALESGHTYQDIEGEEEEILKKNYFVFTDGAIRVKPGNWIFPKNYLRYANLIYNFTAKPTDIYVATYMKSGTTWMQEIVWNLVNNPNLDNPLAEISLDARFPNFEADMILATTGAPPPDPNGDPMKMLNQLCPGKHYLDGLLVHLAAYAPDPRMNKLHLPLCFLPPDIFKLSKVIYVARDPRDVILSFYHFVRLHVLWGFRGTFEEFVQDFINDRIVFGPYFQHLALAWERRNDPNFLMIFYEDLKADAKKEIKKVDQFLGTNRTDKQIDNINTYTSFSQMKERSKKNQPTSNDNSYFDKEVEKKEGGFFRKGETGGWKGKFTPELNAKVNAWMSKNLAQFSQDFKYKAENI